MSGFGCVPTSRIYGSSGHSCLAISSPRKNTIQYSVKQNTMFHLQELPAMVNFKVIKESDLIGVRKLKATKFHFSNNSEISTNNSG